MMCIETWEAISYISVIGNCPLITIDTITKMSEYHSSLKHEILRQVYDKWTIPRCHLCHTLDIVDNFILASHVSDIAQCCTYCHLFV